MHTTTPTVIDPANPRLRFWRGDDGRFRRQASDGPVIVGAGSPLEARLIAAETGAPETTACPSWCGYPAGHAWEQIDTEHPAGHYRAHRRWFGDCVAVVAFESIGVDGSPARLERASVFTNTPSEMTAAQAVAVARALVAAASTIRTAAL